MKHAASFDPQKVHNAMAFIWVETIMVHGKPHARGLSTIEGLTFQIENGNRVIVWPKHIAEAKYTLQIPSWEGRSAN